MLHDKEIIQALSGAYSPCQSFGNCKEAKWKPEEGYFVSCTRRM